MDYTRDQLVFAAREMLDQGNRAAARGIALKIQEMDDAARAEFDPTEGMSGVDKFLVGAGKGLTDAGRGAQDLWHRISGDEKALAELNALADEEDAMFERDLGDSLAASGGRLVGEIAATAPVGFGVAGAFSRAGMAARTGLAAATEGAISEGVIERGGAGERLLSAGQGAAFGKLADMGIQRFNRRLHKGRMDYEVDQAAQLPDDANSRMLAAREDGGFTLDAAQATQDDELLDHAARLARADKDMGQFRQAQDTDIIDRARGIIRDFDGSLDELNTVDAQVRAGELLQETGTAMREADYARVNQAWADWRSATGGQEQLDLPGLREDATAVLDNALVSVKNKIGKDLQEVFDKYLPESNRVTADTYQKVMQELNGIYDDAGSSRARNTIREVKEAISANVGRRLDGMTGDGQETVLRGMKANNETREFYANWSRDDVLEKLISKGSDGDMYRREPIRALKAVIGKDKGRELASVRDRIMNSGMPEAKETWRSMQQVPLLEALDKAMSRGRSDAAGVGFDSDTFKSVLTKNYGQKNLRALWGDEAYDDVFRAVEAWRLKDVKSSNMRQGLRQNPSGSGVIAHNAMSGMIRLMASSPAVGQKILAVPSLVRVVTELQQSGLDAAESAALRAGELTPEVAARIRQVTKEAFSKDIMIQYGHVLEALMRSAVRESMQGYREDYSTENVPENPAEKLRAYRQPARGPRRISV